MGWRNFQQDRSSLVSTLSIMVIVLLLISTLFFSRQMTHFLVNELQHKMNISVYFKSDTPSDKIMEVKQDVGNLPEVKQVDYVSKQQALEDFKSTFKGNETLMESLDVIGVNPFLASLNIETHQEEDYQKVADYLNESTYQEIIDHSNYNQTKEIISRVSSIGSATKAGMLSLSVVLALIAVLIAFNTVRLSIVNRSKEISIMRLVGAKSWFIRGPFLVQGALIGVAAVVIATGLFSGGLFLLSLKVQGLLPDLNLFLLYASNFSTYLLLQLGAGVVLAVGSSFIAIRKYLKI